MATKTNAIEVLMTFKKETPGTFVFESTDDESPIQTLYIKKFGLPEGAPISITITITVGEK
jgi:hypothetical protein